MAKEVIMPALGMAQETGILIQWFKAEGEQVTQGELLMEIETDKATVEVEAPASGTLANVTAQPGDEFPVGHTIALILAPGEVSPTGEAPPRGGVAPKAGGQTGGAEPSLAAATAGGSSERSNVLASPLAARIARENDVDLAQIKAAGERIQKEDVLLYLERQQGEAEKGASGRVLASPKARRLAQEQGLSLATIAGSGPDGAVLAADVSGAASTVQTSAPAPAATPVTEQTVPTSRMWRVMAQRLTESWQTIPHFYLEREVNAAQLLHWWQGSMARVSDKVTLTDLLVKVVATALRQHPRANASWRDATIILNEAVNVGLAVAVEDGLLVPVIHQADRLDLAALSERRQAVVERARSGKVQPDDLQGGTFTISNLGMFGVDAFKAIVNPPQAAILAVGRIADRIVPVDGQPGVQPMMTLTLSCDHRVIDGVRAAQFLQSIVRFIEEPLALLD